MVIIAVYAYILTYNMSNKVYITEKFKSELSNLNCGFGEDYIDITRTEGDKVFFKSKI